MDRRLAGRAKVAAVVGAVMVVTLLVHLRAVRQPLFDDDWLYLDRLQSVGFRGLFPSTSQDFALFRPGVAAWFVLMRSLFGLHAEWWHVSAALLLGLTGCAVFAVLRRVGADRAPAGVGAALFLLHPAWDSPIAWASAVSSVLLDLLTCCCFLLLLSERRSRRAMAVVVVLLALLCKENAAIIPLEAAALCWVVRRPVRTSVLDCLPLVEVVAVYVGVLRPLFVQTSTPDVYKLSAAPGVIVRTLYDLAAPLGWIPLRASVPQARLVGLALCLLLVAVAAGVARRRGAQGRLVVVSSALAVYALLPVTLLAHQVMSPYYLDQSLIWMAALTSVAASAVFPTGLQRLSTHWRGTGPVAPRAALAASLLLLAAVTAARLDVSPDAQRTRQILAGALRVTHARGQTVVHLERPTDYYLTDGGGLFRVERGDPHFRIAVTGAGLTPAFCHLPWVTCV